MALEAIIHRKRPSWLQRFGEAPFQTLAKSLYAHRQHLINRHQPCAPKFGIEVVCISDTHNSRPDLPPGDLLIHAGDLTQGGKMEELQAQLDWLSAQPHSPKVVIAGNHDIVLDDQRSAELGMSPSGQRSLSWGSIIYLQHSAANLRTSSGNTLTIFGHPSTRKHGNWAFQYDPGIDVFTHEVPDNVDILVTHSPPQFHLDLAEWGDKFLLRELWRVKPKLHVFGHIHEGCGQDMLLYDHFEDLYERICAGSGEALALLLMLLLFIRTLVIGPERGARRTILANASAVGGLRDQYHRKAQVVQL